MHCMAALDSPTSVRVVIDGVDLHGLKDRPLTQLRRDRLGFVFQAYNLVPTLTAREDITLPADIAGDDLNLAWFDTVVDTLGIRDRVTHDPSGAAYADRVLFLVDGRIVGDLADPTAADVLARMTSFEPAGQGLRCCG
jgi:ABC-type lipoprotein export system ATPase subunit